MNFFNWFFKAKEECPRCLGKGFVDDNDIARLNKVLQWLPGKCAYCNGRGKVTAGTAKKVPADITYLTTDLTPGERTNLMKGESCAMQRAVAYDTEINNEIIKIRFLFFNGNLSVNQITDFYLLSVADSTNRKQQREELLQYINKVISNGTHNN